MTTTTAGNALPPPAEPQSLPPTLTDLDLTNIRHNISPVILEMIADNLVQSAARLRANGFYGQGGRA